MHQQETLKRHDQPRFETQRLVRYTNGAQSPGASVLPLRESEKTNTFIGTSTRRGALLSALISASENYRGCTPGLLQHGRIVFETVAGK